eukprot:15275057-Alexandrium_andersonii.AAC.1
MGWSWAVFVAQTYSEDALLDPATGLESFGWRADSRLIEGAPAAPSDPLCGLWRYIYIDDFGRCG